MTSKMNQLFEEQRSVHVLYAYHGIKNYLEQVVSYTEIGVANGDYVILIENDRLYPMIEKELSSRLTANEMKFVHRVNSFDFYFSSGSYHPPAIHEYFKKTVQPYVESNLSFRSWAHVEWDSMEEPLHLIEDFEKIVDEAVNDLSFPLICAYDGERMPDYLINILMETHPYVLMEEEFFTSKQYLA
ncbi:MEDS domain-containing protein [Guptibacillus hwajinpoensis]|uniref:MEDS domain-containing protein n=1 Tax=Guptibacillus hwajinpoensis TaxID=208199 RepID=UPI00273D639A|nr:MEDS domain-containing protein [Pseudalkalibacillus hwajinpoensis]WLR59269.1 MEDS domain-containing protein [Pseudalkalibacillus hwajinpoensis]